MATTTAAACGPAGIPALLATGLLAGTFAVLSDEFEVEVTLTKKDLENVQKQLEKHILEVSARQSALVASSLIRTSFDWYAHYNARLKGDEKFSEEDKSEFRRSLLDAIGPNSNLSQALGLLAKKEVGLHDLPQYSLASSLYVKLMLHDVVLQADRGEKSLMFNGQKLAEKPKNFLIP